MVLNSRVLDLFAQDFLWSRYEPW